MHSLWSEWHDVGSCVLNWEEGTVTPHQPLTLPSLGPAKPPQVPTVVAPELCPATLTHLFAVLPLAQQPKPQPQAGLKAGLVGGVSTGRYLLKITQEGETWFREILL